jgi:hypothetical protein
MVGASPPKVTARKSPPTCWANTCVAECAVEGMPKVPMVNWPGLACMKSMTSCTDWKGVSRPTVGTVALRTIMNRCQSSMAVSSSSCTP